MNERREERRQERERIEQIKREAREEAIAEARVTIKEAIKKREVERMTKEATESKGAQIARKMREGFAPSGAKLPDQERIKQLAGLSGNGAGFGGVGGTPDYAEKVNRLLGNTPKKKDKVKG